MDAGLFAEAEAIYRSVIKDDGSNTQAIFMLALTRKAQGDPAEAAGLLEQAKNQDPDNANIHYTLGTIQMSQGVVDEARKSFLAALQADPTHIDSHNGLAFAELSRGNYVAAENAANLALGEDGSNVQALVYMGTAKLEQGDPTKAIAYLQEALKESPTHQSAQLVLGRAFLAAGNTAFAIQCFQNVVDLDDSSALAWEFLGLAHRTNGSHEDAAGSFLKALSLGRKTKLVMENLAEYDQAQGTTGSATGSEADPEARLISAEFEIARGSPAAALEILERIAMDGSNRVVLLKSRALEQMRNHAAALALVEPLVKGGEAPDETQLAYVRLLSKSGQQEAADQWIDDLLSGDDPPLFARMFRGFQLCQGGKEEGIKALQDLESEEGLSDVDQRRIAKTLAEALDRSGRYEEAAVYYAKLTGRLAQVVSVAESCAKENRELLESKADLPAQIRVQTAILPSDPVFMFAWPGSGWEWLAAGLGSHSSVMLVADKPETQAKRRALICAPAGKSELKEFTSESAGLAAGAYWADLKSGQLEPGNKTTVDVMWVSADMLPTIARIFPAARVLVVTREPRDMVLDWFRSGYDELQDMAAIYRDQLEALQQYREKLQIEFIDVDGDAVQTSAVTELESLCEKLGLTRDDSAGTRLEATVPRVDKARGRWIDYAETLAGPLRLFDSE